MNKNHVVKDITNASMIPSDLIMLSTVEISEDGDSIIESTKQPVGLMMGISLGDNRPVNTQGEIGSKYLVTLINEGQQYLSFQRLVPLPNEIGAGAPVFKSLLPLLYGSDDVIAYDFDEDPKYSRPIQLILEIRNAAGDIETLIWLKNASVGSTSMSFVAGANYTAEPISLSWEEAVYLDPGI